MRVYLVSNISPLLLNVCQKSEQNNELGKKHYPISTTSLIIKRLLLPNLSESLIREFYTLQKLNFISPAFTN